MKILADAHIPYLKGVAEQFGKVSYLPGDQFTKEAVKDKDVLIVRTVTHFDEKILKDSNVKLICSATIGFDHIDTDYCDAHNIAWRTAPGCNARSVEQYVTASLIYMAEKNNFKLKDKTIGIVGVGNVGKEVARACELFGMKVLLNDPPRRETENSDLFVDLETIQKQADIITFHTPLIREGRHPTFHLADGIFFDDLNRKPIIINTSRGAVVDNQALKNSLKAGNVSGAIIDTWENEPNIDLKLLQLVDIATPHIAGYSADGKWNATRMSLYSINDFFNLKKEHIELIPIPEPENKEIDLSRYAVDEQIAHAVLHTYNPLNDSKLLKENPDNFYYFRSHYPLRREYKAYNAINLHEQNQHIMRNLGFITD
ncbi:MAG: 4-phosphoerythronate dehydrogenase PdxB [Dysgonamonadaceae bacterium]|nr:4-phosphoerythronate dehydrogenase PdxB [Dysgonamonadaceae bacterium]MDD3355677.1 4-phosphoerythronate dehydrogenase PdxB [Dysgonamonadaceae bacterium]MDD3727092.1 4-phosphoerythronate dehydrogenase PdxB [Dysgonamonadaceae bacterium]MDD4246899.1 4-phosphoerythronate dehydrogenase PdxB [Dysgonamonadaceae bacterium]MDD4604912.1 4-phosphoerythronate dehydrogenase PdxB [Dysgonamonadaceae bacterium]